MRLRTAASILALGVVIFSGSASAYDCSGLSEWKRQVYYLVGARVQYQQVAYEDTGEPSKRDVPDAGYPWSELGACDSTGGGGDPAEPQSISVYGAWHCGSDYCTWASERDMTEFDFKNHWLIDRGDGRPSVNLVVLSFVHPLKLLRGTNDEQTSGGLPIGMTSEVVNYFKEKGIRVMLSIGGITYVDAWNEALAEDPWKLGEHAAGLAQALGVGIEIDYEENTNPDLDGLATFIAAYRYFNEYDPTGECPSCRLTIDLAAGDRWLIALTERATREWLKPENPVLDYANAMVTPRQSTAADTVANWQEHIDGKPQYDPPILPLAPAKLTGSLWLVGRKPAPECVDFASSLQKGTGNYVQTVAPNGAGLTNGMLGYMFWAAECQGTRAVCTTPPNSCEGGMGVAASVYDIPVPMGPLRQE